MERNCDKSWLITKEIDGWYYWSDLGNPYGPFDTQENAEDMQHLYEISWEMDE